MTTSADPLCKLAAHSLSPASREYKQAVDHMVKQHASELAPIHPHLSSSSKRFLQKVVDMMRHADRNWKSSVVDEVTPQIDAAYMANIQSKHWYEWIAPPLRDILERDTKIGKQYKLSIHGKTVDVHFIVPHTTMRLHPESFSEKNREKYWQHAIRRMVVWLYVAYSFAHETCQHHSTMYFFMTYSKKESLTYDDPLQPVHTNSGASNVCLATGHLLVYRYEEWFKVFLHETFHFLGLEFSQVYEDHAAELRSIVARAFPRCLPTTKWMIYETYCETWAEILNVVFLSFYGRNARTHTRWMTHVHRRGRKSSRATTTRRFQDVFACHSIVAQVEAYLQYEQWFSLLQCVKLLKHFQLTYAELFTQDTEHAYDHAERYDLFSYHVLKSIWMYRVNDFIEWCVAHNQYGDDAQVSLDFMKTRDAMMDYVKTMIGYSRDKDLLLGYEQAEKWLLHGSAFVAGSKIVPIQKTLRMTMFD
jgi:hypothetical protein